MTKHSLIDDSVLKHMKSLTLLCVENDKVTRQAYKLIFEDFVGKLVFASDGEKGYEKFLDQEIDIIISDYSMPILNGLEMIGKIRALDKEIPIILVTAMQEIGIVIKALELNVNSFVRKPIMQSEVTEALTTASKLIIANNYLQEQRDEKVRELEKDKAYVSYQEELGFAKELNILRNDFYYQMINHTGICLLDFLYHPLDGMSGDAYSARRIDENTTFYLIVDGMGKGLSASLTAMIITSFINHVVDSMLSTDSYDLAVLINESMKYIQPILLDEESLAIDYIEINNIENMLYYSKFAMPAILMENRDKEVIRLKSNNPPLSKWQDTFNIDSYDISDIYKFLVYSDGIVENETICVGMPYADFIEEDFVNSFTREDLKKSFLKKIDNQEDDFTLLYIHKLSDVSKELSTMVFDTSLDETDRANEWYDSIWQDITDDKTISYKAGLVFTELFMNAYEHGNLGIDSSTKHSLINEDKYFDTLLSMQKECIKKITVKIDKIEHINADYIITQITDEGDGFDTKILSKIFRNSANFNGRGVFVSRSNSLGIYYKSKGNSVLYLNKVNRMK